MKFYADLADLPEDERITIIGRTVVERRLVVAVAVDAWPGKLDRYISKLTRKFPTITRWETHAGLVAGTWTLKIYPPVE